MRTIKIVLMIALLSCLATISFGSNTNESTESRTSVEEKFVGVLIGQLGVDVEKLSDETRLHEDLGADELDLVELLMALEESFDITVSDKQWAGVTTIESAVDLIFEIRNPTRW